MQGSKPVIGFRVEVIVEPDEVGFHAYCPALKGFDYATSTTGRTPYVNEENIN